MRMTAPKITQRTITINELMEDARAERKSGSVPPDYTWYRGHTFSGVALELARVYTRKLIHNSSRTFLMSVKTTLELEIVFNGLKYFTRFVLLHRFTREKYYTLKAIKHNNCYHYLKQIQTTGLKPHIRDNTSAVQQSYTPTSAVEQR